MRSLPLPTSTVPPPLVQQGLSPQPLPPHSTTTSCQPQQRYYAVSRPSINNACTGASHHEAHGEACPTDEATASLLHFQESDEVRPTVPAGVTFSSRALFSHSLAAPTRAPLRPAVAFSLASVALAALPLLHLLRHAELAAHGLTAVLAAAAAAAVAASQALRGVMRAALPHFGRKLSARTSKEHWQHPQHAAAAAANHGWAGNYYTTFVLPLPAEVALQPLAAVLLLLPLITSTAAAMVAMVSPAVAPAVAHSRSSIAGFWFRAALLYVAALLVPSPGPGIAERSVGSSRSSASRSRWLHSLFSPVVAQGLRVLLLLAGSWAAASGAAASGGEGIAAALATWVWLGIAGPIWAFHFTGALATAAARGS